MPRNERVREQVLRTQVFLTPAEDAVLQRSAKVLGTSKSGLLRAFVQALGSNDRLRVARETGDLIIEEADHGEQA